MAARFAVSHDELEPAQVSGLLRPAAPDFGGQAGLPGEALAQAGLPAEALAEAGAVITFEGLVRGMNQGREVLRLEYEGYEPMIVKVFEQIGAEVAAVWPGTASAIHHRLGALSVGDTSIVIVTASAHRAAAYAASRYVIERVKQIAPIWKHEYFEGGDVWIEGAVAAADDEAARKRAMEAACA